ncbi:MAG: nitrate reductase cytochrome c-type subunit [Burkholderiales bacterium]|jgi:cytochrome c-type protein NapB|nr:nitrate reductase cytochrome c-type subunit [Burkholderiales bacterium]
MKSVYFVIVSILLVGLAACVGQPIADKNLGLSKTSAFDTTTPQPFTRDGAGVKGDAVAAYGMPPLIPHDVSAYEPITQSSNMCISCHTFAARGTPREAGQPTPLPLSHFDKGKLKNAQYYCSVCHTPAADVPDLVKNTGPKPKR